LSDIRASDTPLHFITQFGSVRGDVVGKPWACVTVRVERSRRPCTLRIQEGIFVLKHDTLIVPLPDGVVVLQPDGKRCKPTGRFYVTTESFDPCHLLTDIF
jgi:hypothetical protein